MMRVSLLAATPTRRPTSDQARGRITRSHTSVTDEGIPEEPPLQSNPSEHGEDQSVHEEYSDLEPEEETNTQNNHDREHEASDIGRDCSMNKNPRINLWRTCQIRRWRRSQCGEWSRRYPSRLHRAPVSGPKLLIFINFEAAPRHRAATDRGTLGICARLRVAEHLYHLGRRSGEVVGARQLSWRIDDCFTIIECFFYFLLRDHLI